MFYIEGSDKWMWLNSLHSYHATYTAKSKLLIKIFKKKPRTTEQEVASFSTVHFWRWYELFIIIFIESILRSDHFYEDEIMYMGMAHVIMLIDAQRAP